MTTTWYMQYSTEYVLPANAPDQARRAHANRPASAARNAPAVARIRKLDDLRQPYPCSQGCADEANHQICDPKAVCVADRHQPLCPPPFLDGIHEMVVALEEPQVVRSPGGQRLDRPLLVEKVECVLAVLDQPSGSFLEPPKDERREDKE